MMPLPNLDTANFDAELPFDASPLSGGACTPQQMRETRLALRVLAAPVDSAENTDPLLQRLEAKLDLALEVSLLTRYPDRLPLTRCRIGMEAIGWCASAPLNPGTPLLLTLFPNPDSALVLYLATSVQLCQPSDSGFQLTVDIRSAFSEYTLRLWEKWVFRRHRRAILDR
jgi:hypothetical protein